MSGDAGDSRRGIAGYGLHGGHLRLLVHRHGEMRTCEIDEIDLRCASRS